MIYFIVTTSILINYEIRKRQYTEGISKLQSAIHTLGIEAYRIIIIDNNGQRPTYLDTLGCDVLYTNNNSLPISNNGYKELQDILDCITHYNIADTDFIVKMTGRYILEDNSEFMLAIQNQPTTQHDCIIKFGSFNRPVDYQMNDCITGLIGMRCSFVKQIVKPQPNECVEWKWGQATYLIDAAKIHKVDRLGIRICPGSNSYFSV